MALDARDLELDHVVAEEGHDPLDRPAKRRLPGAPAHGLAERDRESDLRERGWEQGHRRLPSLAPRAGQVLALGGLDAAEIADRAPELVGERFGSAGGHAVLEGGLDRRARELLLEVRLPRCDALDKEGEAAGRAVGMDGLLGEPQLAEALLREIRQG